MVSLIRSVTIVIAVSMLSGLRNGVSDGRGEGSEGVAARVGPKAT